MTKLDDVRRSVGSKVGAVTPAKAREFAKDLLEPGTAKERVDKVASDLLEWSQRNTERIRELIRREIADQLSKAGLASQADLDALTKRVRTLERAKAKPSASTRSKASSTGTSRTAKSGGTSGKG